MGKWQLQEAKNKLSQVVDLACREGPQRITVHGRETVVVLAIETYRQLTEPKERLVDFLRRSPLAGVALDLDRSVEPPRDVEL